ncbi:Defensin-like protein [Cucumis melo var. makuwa]|uniref:Defensin-like protein n=1 Tax=Cucumis melo var. makuwa TaxID=1194695 RepID=A0A5A7V4W2_CUCMM|nr:Defensin-like protein [Cucumis melo var. makuwa]
MKSVSFSAILLALLLIFNGETMMKSVEGVGGLCEKALHGGGCKDAEWISGCKALFGKGAMGLEHGDKLGKSALVGRQLDLGRLELARIGSHSARGMARGSVG